MTELIKIQDGHWVQPRKVASVKESGLDDEKCVVTISGQSAVDGGFLIDRRAEDVVSDINEALREAVEE